MERRLLSFNEREVAVMDEWMEKWAFGEEEQEQEQECKFFFSGSYLFWFAGQ